jgi:hypothetical protein
MASAYSSQQFAQYAIRNTQYAASRPKLPVAVAQTVDVILQTVSAVPPSKAERQHAVGRAAGGAAQRARLTRLVDRRDAKNAELETERLVGSREGMTAAAMLAAGRGYWRVENELRLRLDVTAGADRSRVSHPASALRGFYDAFSLKAGLPRGTVSRCATLTTTALLLAPQLLDSRRYWDTVP